MKTIVLQQILAKLDSIDQKFKQQFAALEKNIKTSIFALILKLQASLP